MIQSLLKVIRYLTASVWCSSLKTWISFFFGTRSSFHSFKRKKIASLILWGWSTRMVEILCSLIPSPIPRNVKQLPSMSFAVSLRCPSFKIISPLGSICFAKKRSNINIDQDNFFVKLLQTLCRKLFINSACCSVFNFWHIIITSKTETKTVHINITTPYQYYYTIYWRFILKISLHHNEMYHGKTQLIKYMNIMMIYCSFTLN